MTDAIRGGAAESTATEVLPRSTPWAADPESGLSFTCLSNCRSEEPFHSRRLDRGSNIVHAALVEL